MSSDIQFANLDGAKIVSAGSVDKLIEWLINPESSRDFTYAFFLIYRKFVTPASLFQRLLVTFTQSSDEKVKYNILDVLRCWISHHRLDFFNTAPDGGTSANMLYTELHNFIQQISQTYQNEGEDLMRRYYQLEPGRKRSQMLSRSQLGKAPKPLRNQKRKKSRCPFFEYPALEIARQLCLISFDLYSKIEYNELLEFGWTDPEKKHLSPNVLKMIQRSNNMSQWTATFILSQSTIKRKIKAYQKLEEVATRCLEFQNINGFSEIVSGLRSLEVIQEQKTWTDPPSSFLKSQRMIEKYANKLLVNKFGISTKNPSVEPPCVPYLGKYLTFLIHIDEGNPTMSGNLINFRKAMLLASVIKEIQRFQSVPYCFQIEPKLRSFLMAIERNEQKPIVLECGSAEAKITLLSQRSSLLTDMNNSNLESDRGNMWLQWYQDISSDSDKILYSTEDGGKLPFLDVLLRSNAIEHSLQSALMKYPKLNDIQLFVKILQLSILPEISIASLVELFENASHVKFSETEYASIAKMVCSFKCLCPAHPSLGHVSQCKLPSEKDLSDLKKVYSHRSDLNKLAVELTDKIQENIQHQKNLEMHLHLLVDETTVQNLEQISHFISEQTSNLSKIVEDLLTRVPEQKPRHVSTVMFKNKVEADLHAMRYNLYQLDQEITETSIKLQQEIIDFDQLIVDKREILLSLADVESVISTFALGYQQRIAEPMLKYTHWYTQSLLALKSYFDHAIPCFVTLGSSLNSTSQDIFIMGARYGAGVAEAMRTKYTNLKKTFLSARAVMQVCLSACSELTSTVPDIPPVQQLCQEILLLRDALVTNVTQIENAHPTIG